MKLMEKRIKTYEKFIHLATSKPLTDKERAELAAYHSEMVANFQRERLIHLLIMLFFVALALALLSVLSILIVEKEGFVLELAFFYALVAIVFALTVAYIRHYYFLENHIQALYGYTKKLMLKE